MCIIWTENGIMKQRHFVENETDIMQHVLEMQ